MRAGVTHEVHEKPGERSNFDIRNLAGAVSDETDPLTNSEQWSLSFVLQYRDDDPVEEKGSTLNEIEVAVGQRIE